MGRFLMDFETPSNVLRTSGGATPPTGDGAGQAEPSRVKKRWETPRVILQSMELANTAKPHYKSETNSCRGSFCYPVGPS